MSNSVNKELRTKTNEELCALVFRMKMQLLESRFKMAAGDMEKTHTIVDIRRTVARILTILKQRKIDLTIGTHGVTMYDRNDNTVTSLTKYVQAIFDRDKKTHKETINATQATIPDDKTIIENKPSVPIVKEELKSNMQKKKADRTVIHKSVGGGA
jgi:large subunit ribosomal protein L29